MPATDDVNLRLLAEVKVLRELMLKMLQFDTLQDSQVGRVHLDSLTTLDTQEKSRAPRLGTQAHELKVETRRVIAWYRDQIEGLVRT